MKARTTKINRAASAPRRDLEHYCRDLNGWPRSWMGLEKDLPPGEQLVASFRPFLEYLAASDLSPKTIQKHVDNMWALGGEFIRDLNDDPSLRKRPVEQHLFNMIEDGGRDETPRTDHCEALPGEDRLATKKGRRHPQISPTRHKVNRLEIESGQFLYTQFVQQEGRHGNGHLL